MYYDKLGTRNHCHSHYYCMYRVLFCFSSVNEGGLIPCVRNYYYYSCFGFRIGLLLIGHMLLYDRFVF